MLNQTLGYIMYSFYSICMQYRNDFYDFFIYLIFFAISYFNIVVLYLNERYLPNISIYILIANYKTKINIYNIFLKRYDI